MHSFTTKRLLIRPLTVEDQTFYCQQYSNEKVMRHTGGALSEEEARKVFHRVIKANERAINNGKKTLLTWAIVCLKAKVIIGMQTLSFRILPYNTHIMKQECANGMKQAEIGIMLNRKANGKLFPEEAMGALMEYGFTQLKLERINAFYASKNLATKRFVDKLGFIFPISFQDNSDKTSYQYFDYSQWQQKLIKKIFITMKA